MTIDDDVNDIVFGGVLDGVTHEIKGELAIHIQTMVNEYKQDIGFRGTAEKHQRELIKQLQSALDKITWISKHPASL